MKKTVSVFLIFLLGAISFNTSARQLSIPGLPDAGEVVVADLSLPNIAPSFRTSGYQLNNPKKVKKIAYFDDGKLWKEYFFNTLGQLEKERSFGDFAMDVNFKYDKAGDEISYQYQSPNKESGELVTVQHSKRDGYFVTSKQGTDGKKLIYADAKGRVVKISSIRKGTDNEVVQSEISYDDQGRMSRVWNRRIQGVMCRDDCTSAVFNIKYDGDSITIRPEGYESNVVGFYERNGNSVRHYGYWFTTNSNADSTQTTEFDSKGNWVVKTTRGPDGTLYSSSRREITYR